MLTRCQRARIGSMNNIPLTTKEGGSSQGPAPLPLAAALLAVAVVSVFTGGLGSPWMALMYVPLVLSGFRSLRLAFAAAVWAIVLYMGVAALRPGSVSNSPSIALGEIGTMFAVALVTGWLIQRADAWRCQVACAADVARSALDVQQMISAAYDLEVTLDLVSLKQREVLAADSCAVLLVQDGSLVVRASIGLGACLENGS
jgi:hypothetical protein